MYASSKVIDDKSLLTDNFSTTYEFVLAKYRYEYPTIVLI
jgi:hypothetical protein